MSDVSFQVQLTFEDALAFARLSGDWNPLHTEPAYASTTAFARPVLHGAFAAGLVSRMAGMHLPGRECLLHNMQLRFIAPIIPPAAVTVTGRSQASHHGLGRVAVTISDSSSGTRYVDATYEYSLHVAEDAAGTAGPRAEPRETTEAPILVTGASGALGKAVLRRLEGRSLGVSRSGSAGLQVSDLERIGELDLEKVSGIVHCAWPSPDNEWLTRLANAGNSVEHHVATPLRQAIALGRFLAERGTPGATLVMIGSTAAYPGRHNYRMPLYTLAKALVPELTRILATELASVDRRCVALTFDVIDGGMNERISPAARVAHTDRIPRGQLPDMAEAADQVAWVIDNVSHLVSGANIQLTAAAAP